MYNAESKDIAVTDYPRAEINLSHITVNLIISIYFYSLNFVIINSYSDIFDTDNVSFSFVIMLIITLLLIRYIYNTCKNTNIAPFLVFIVLLLIVFFLRVYIVFLSFIINMLYASYTLFLLVFYGSMHKKFINKYENMINFDKYRANFLVVFIVSLSGFIILFFFNAAYIVNNVPILKFYFMLHNNFLFNFLSNFLSDKNGSIEPITAYISSFYLIPAGICCLILIFYKVFLLNYKYVFALLPLSMYTNKIPVSAVTSEFNKDNIDTDALRQWFNDDVNSYIKNVSLDVENNMIVFNKSESTENNQHEIFEYIDNSHDDTVYSLDEAVKKLDELMELVVYKGTNLTNILYNMKECLGKINKLHTRKSSYDKYIDKINSKYMPYVEYLVKTYLRNIDLNDETYAEIQQKIVYTLEEIGNIMQTIYKSKTEFVKFNLDIELDTIDLLIKQKGYNKDTI